MELGMTENTKAALGGLRVLDFTWVYAGPFATRQLADLGAEVIKIEPRVTGALERRFYRVASRNGVTQSSYSMSLNRGKKSVSVDVRNAKGFSIICDLIKKSDIIISNMAPGAMKSLGLGYDEVKEINPQIIYCSISCFGQTGSYANEPGFDIIAQAASSWCGQVDPPAVAPVAIGDANAGIHAVAAILARVKLAAASVTMISPSRKTVMRSADCRASSSTCVIKMMETPASFKRFSKAKK